MLADDSTHKTDPIFWTSTPIIGINNPAQLAITTNALNIIPNAMFNLMIRSIRLLKLIRKGTLKCHQILETILFN